MLGSGEDSQGLLVGGQALCMGTVPSSSLPLGGMASHSHLFLELCFLPVPAGKRSTEQAHGFFVFRRMSICQGARGPASLRQAFIHF